MDEVDARRKEWNLLTQRWQQEWNDSLESVEAVATADDALASETVEVVALRVLGQMRETRDALGDAERSLALALMDRGTPTAAVARALGVSRGTLINWQRDR